MSIERIVIVGAGLAGAKGAQAVREAGFEGQLTLVGEEHEFPYERPPLSKEFLMGRKPRNDSRVHEPTWYDEHGVDVRLGVRASAVNRELGIVELEDGQSLAYDRLMLATGSRPRHPAFPGADAEGVHYLRTIGDSERLKATLAKVQSVAIVGAGWIGLEAAAAARDAGVQVTVVEPQTLPLLSVLGAEMGALFAELHRRHGVELRLGVEVDAVLVRDGRPYGLALGDDTVVHADAVLIAVGAVPNTELAQQCGLAVDRGVLTDAALRTSDPAVTAAGDVARAEHPVLGGRIRVEHWANALKQPAVAAATMLGQPAVYADLPYFFTDQFDLGMEYVGYVEPEATPRIVLRGAAESGEFIAFWTVDGRVRAGMNVNVWDVTDDVKALILSGKSVDVDRLADPRVPLSEL
ncbi:FAD-dependent oxidoreductase [Jatrophihabitans telluris]|uniref:FAD-dependent oxidoreductase n=1 Tax=Jatrophihabitans telluris TaxID=2038343 RepID=A0ABY4R3W8_9ACTN|nr:FAD-dependent oxidoreductase [Jatrophihabitans telluris]UQX89841.1 FAD-dependent oxidoreductase [Jatrophihabitans telluris]